jgi:Polysaccharide deacetylase
MTHRRAAKGFLSTVRRASVVPRRYGLSPRKLQDSLAAMIRDLAALGVIPSIHVTGNVVDRHPAIVNTLSKVEVGIHGYLHTAYAGLSNEQQRADLSRASAALCSRGLDPKGFRSPYLHANGQTLAILAEAGYLYDSSNCWLVPLDEPSKSRSLAQAVSTRYESIPDGRFPIVGSGRVVELPVALPDDEILVDELRVTSPEVLSRVFHSMLSSVAKASGLLVFQIHPERYSICSEAVLRTIRSASSLGGWIASLGEIAEWVRSQNGGVKKWPNGRNFALSITGDLDALTIGDFATRFGRVRA